MTGRPTNARRRARPEWLGHRGIQMGFALLGVALFWSASSYGYYALVSALGLTSGYNEAPVTFAIYYLIWSGIALIWFRNDLTDGLAVAPVLAQMRAMLPLLAACAAFAALLLPLLPPVAMWRAPADPPEFMFASGWYYLPKSADILFQQALVAALIFRATALEFRLRSIAIGLALAFGGFHLLLALDGFLPLYVARFTVAASLFGLIAPYVYLRRPLGFRWAYGLHWSFYALDATLTHFLLAVPKWMIF